MQSEAIYIGLDVGTSGARAIAMNHGGAVVAYGKSMMKDHGDNFRDPNIWWTAAKTALHAALAQTERASVVALSVDATSGTTLAISADGEPLADAKMYNDRCDDQEIIEKVACNAPLESAARGTTSALARALWFQAALKPARLVHQADWIAGRLCGVYASDDNNALKTGYDPLKRCWPGWISKTGLDLKLLPEVNPPGFPVAQILPDMAVEFGLPKSVMLVTGTTDGCASFLATGAQNPGDGVSALGTTLTIKILSDQPIFAPSCGVYSHHIMGKWLAGGASNSGGNVLAAYFTLEEMAELSLEIDPETDSSLDYYPLIKPGERFPVSDPEFLPRISPIPDDRAGFLKGLLEGIADIEALAYSKLAQLGAPKLTSVRSVGGGAGNPVWTRLRERRLGVEMLNPLNNEAAYGAARLARAGMSS